LAVIAGCAAGQPVGTGTGGSSGDGGSGVASGGTGGTATGGASGTGGSKGTGGQIATSTGVFVSASSFTLNCKSPVAADPVDGTFTVLYSNATASAVDFTFTSATLTFEIPQSSSRLVWTFAVSPGPPRQLPAHATTTIMHTKVAGSGSGPVSGISLCDYCADQMIFRVDYSAAGDSLNATAVGGGAGMTPVNCTF
jgi:hypothetical protein